MNPTEIEFAVRDLVSKPFDAETFPYDLMGIYNASKMTVSRLKSGTMNKAKQPGDVLWQKHLFFRPAALGEDVGAIGDALSVDPLTEKYKPRFVLVTNGQQVHVRDLEFSESENIEFHRLDEKSDFLLPLAGFERRTIVEEHPADLKAAKKLKKLYDAILASNPTWNSGHHSHELNLLMTRLLFCFYADDTGIFDRPQLFASILTQQTTEDGSDVAPLLARLFRIMNVESAARPKGTPAADATFPYVNGSLFEQSVEIPHFDRTARRQLLECGDLDWTTINPDIFGSMIQTVAQDGTRSDLGMHYTSVPNIMKALKPLFLDNLAEAYEKAKDSARKLEALLGRLAKIRVFDPACGSGNFLVIAYKALRDLEIKALIRIGEISINNPLRLSSISLQHFYGIDVVDFACETAKLSLWIAEHQMNAKFRSIFGTARPTLPLSRIATIHCGNAIGLDWLTICPKSAEEEIYVCGNPPYQGFTGHSEDQRRDIVATFSSIIRKHQAADYVACWFVKLAEYISADGGPATGALVATNSVTRGEQVPILWPYIFAKGLFIGFAHTAFKWANSASHNAGVSCVIVGLTTSRDEPRKLFIDDTVLSVRNINAYLVPSATNLVVTELEAPANGFPELYIGNEAYDGGNLILSPAEKTALLQRHPEAAPLVRRYYNAKDFLYSGERHVLWIDREHLALAESIPEVKSRINKVRAQRIKGGNKARASANRPYQFTYVTYKGTNALIIPEVSSERREYLQIGLLDARDIASKSLYVVYDPSPYLFAILSSRLHRIWASTISGRLENRQRYSTSMAYNAFPVPTISDEQTHALADRARLILRARAKHPGQALAELYDPDTMPEDLRAAHRDNDAYIEQHIYGKVFRDDTQRLEQLFLLYSRMIAQAGRDGNLFPPTAGRAIA